MALFKRNKDPDWDLRMLSDKELELLTLEELQRIRNKRMAFGMEELRKRAEEELWKRDPRRDWCCLRCGKHYFQEKEILVSGGLFEAWLGWERNKYHAIICNYCGKTEFYKILISGIEDRIGITGI